MINVQYLSNNHKIKGLETAPYIKANMYYKKTADRKTNFTELDRRNLTFNHPEAVKMYRFNDNGNYNFCVMETRKEILIIVSYIADYLLKVAEMGALEVSIDTEHEPYIGENEIIIGQPEDCIYTMSEDKKTVGATFEEIVTAFNKAVGD